MIQLLFTSDADETKNWINEKDKVLSSDDYGKDLASVNALLRKHEALERDLAAVEDKVISVFPRKLTFSFHLLKHRLNQQIETDLTVFRY